jgi:peptidoglycan/LPS O-acetylase OafA/YrhL
MALAVTAEGVRRHGWKLPARLAEPAWAWWLAATALLAMIAATAKPDALMPVSWKAGVLIAALAKVPMAAALALPVLLTDSRTGLIRRALGSRPVAWIGLVSFGLYLWHSWVLSKLAESSTFAHPTIAAWPISWAEGYALSLALAGASWYLIERRAIALGRRISGPGRSGGSEPR